jgi:tRNA C32,U32 (ribose-2'-O)-methylase TrmJ
MGLRHRIREEAMRLGFVVETPAAAGLMLRKDAVSLAVENAADTATAGQVENVKRCLESGVGRVAIVSPQPERLKALAEAMHARLPLEQAMKVGYFGPQELIAELHRIVRTAEKPSRGARRARTPRSSAQLDLPEHTEC